MSERAYGRLLDKYERLEAENERLTGELGQVREILGDREANNTRLREALNTVIADPLYRQMSRTVRDEVGAVLTERRALERKP